MRRQGWAIRLFPMLLLQLYLTITVVMFAFGPWTYPLRHPVELYAFVAASQVALLIGYLAVAHRRPRPAPAAKPPTTYVAVGLIATVAFFPLVSYAETGRWAPNVVGAIMNPAEAYAASIQLSSEGGNFATYLRILAAPAPALLFPMAAFYWSRLGKGLKVAFWIMLIASVAMSVAVARRRDIADLVIMLPLIGIGSHFAGVTVRSTRRIATFALASVAGLVFLLGYFVYSHVQRVGVEAASYGVHPILLTPPDTDNFMLKSAPAEIRPGLVGLINYLSSNYYGLALCMDRDFRPTYGAGQSIFLTRNVAKYLHDPEFETRPYPVQISDLDGYRFPVFWTTSYPYFASDVTFPGTVVLMGVFGALFAMAWVDMLGGKNPYAVVAFSLLSLLLFYLPATNRMLQDGDGVFSFYYWIVVWLWSRRASPLEVRGAA